MTTTIHYGTATVHISDNESASYYRTIVQRIVESGETQWVPFTGTDDSGDSRTVDMLITPGVPVHLTTDSSESADDRLKLLADRYINDWAGTLPVTGDSSQETLTGSEPQTRWLDEKSVSELTRIPVETLRYWRTHRKNLPYAKIGRLVRYSEAAVNAYMQDHGVNPKTGG